MINTPYKQLEKGDNHINPWLQFLIFTGLFIGILIVGNIIGAAIVTAIYGLKTLMALASLDLSAPHLISALWILQISGTTLPIFVAPVIFSYAIVRDPGDYIKPSFGFSWWLLLLVLLIMPLCLPVIELLTNINQKMHLPHFLNGVQKWMEDSEKSAEKITDTILKMNTIWDMLLNLLLIGLLTAIAEEFMFRGVIQTIFARWTKSTHAAIWITAILFSAFHMEFFGFLPRLMLGVLFGYFVVWSGSIWTAVWAHFLNNGIDVFLTFLSQHKLIKMDPNDQHVFDNLIYIFCVVALTFLVYMFRKVTLSKQQIPVE